MCIFQEGFFFFLSMGFWVVCIMLDMGSFFMNAARIFSGMFW